MMHTYEQLMLNMYLQCNSVSRFCSNDHWRAKNTDHNVKNTDTPKIMWVGYNPNVTGAWASGTLNHFQYCKSIAIMDLAALRTLRDILTPDYDVVQVPMQATCLLWQWSLTWVPWWLGYVQCRFPCFPIPLSWIMRFRMFTLNASRQLVRAHCCWYW